MCYMSHIVVSFLLNSYSSVENSRALCGRVVNCSLKVFGRVNAGLSVGLHVGIELTWARLLD